MSGGENGSPGRKRTDFQSDLLRGVDAEELEYVLGFAHSYCMSHTKTGGGGWMTV